MYDIRLQLLRVCIIIATITHCISDTSLTGLLQIDGTLAY